MQLWEDGQPPASDITAKARGDSSRRRTLYEFPTHWSEPDQAPRRSLPPPPRNALRRCSTTAVSAYVQLFASEEQALRPRSSLWDGVDGGEVTVETCDGVLFPACATLFRLVSPVLAAQLSSLSSSSSSSASSSRPHRIRVPETSAVIALLLAIYHPSAEPPSADLLGTFHALIAAEKYKMQKALRHLRSALSALAESDAADPILLYGIACRCGMHELATTAAKRTLRTEPEPAPVMYARLDGLGISAGCLHRLLVYQRKSREAARAVVDGWWRMNLERSCGLGKWGKDGSTPCWYERYMTAIGRQAWPNAASVTDTDLLRGVVSSCPRLKRGYGRKRGPCGYCSNPEKVLMFYNFAKYVGDSIDALVEEVVLAWPEST
ncbi:hypothetical protein GSI_12642 [Ganoderma sinense ZZ0214-1]|uniref:BTB domain-containing protein n=1 Tax=Ganoderma sinense ZZ0214-1 TaxID=1077348 RepID=A0A2G8RTC2_9APHY|nr:hypothetical protein GSI_12642 [Ganoderma sinense ZZ0214-1]